eukprot:1092833-Pelagomonas_calceolata.AAC.3
MALERQSYPVGHPSPEPNPAWVSIAVPAALRVTCQTAQEEAQATLLLELLLLVWAHEQGRDLGGRTSRCTGRASLCAGQHGQDPHMLARMHQCSVHVCCVLCARFV